MVILFIILFRKHIHRFPLAYFRPFPFAELKNLMRVGLPSAGEQLSYSSSQVVITFFINMLGVEALATRTYCVNIIMFVYLFSISMAQGGAICIGHLIGGEETPCSISAWEICDEEVGNDYFDSFMYYCGFRPHSIELADFQSRNYPYGSDCIAD